MEKEQRVIITRRMHGICGMQVCAVKDATDSEILEICNRENPSGTTHGWGEVLREDCPEEQCRPIACTDNPNRLHLLVYR
jgi:hypothetical protein